MAAVPFISNGDMGRSHMCRLLCYIICTDAVAYINDRQGRYMDHIFWSRQNSPIQRYPNTWESWY